MVNDQLFATLATIAADDSSSAGKVLQQSPGYVAGWGSLALINAGLARARIALGSTGS